MKLKVSADDPNYAESAKVAERLLNQPSIVELIERRMELYLQAIMEGKSEEEACYAAGLDPTKEAPTYGSRIPRDVIVLAEFEHLGYTYQAVTWRSDGHSRLRLLVRCEPVNDALGPEWELVFIL